MDSYFIYRSYYHCRNIRYLLSQRDYIASCKENFLFIHHILINLLKHYFRLSSPPRSFLAHFLAFCQR